MSKVDKMFDKAAFGYKPEDVDNYIEQQNYRIAALEAEKIGIAGEDAGIGGENQSVPSRRGRP